jgi:hypothetical protein
VLGDQDHRTTGIGRGLEQADPAMAQGSGSDDRGVDAFAGPRPGGDGVERGKPWCRVDGRHERLAHEALGLHDEDGADGSVDRLHGAVQPLVPAGAPANVRSGMGVLPVFVG